MTETQARKALDLLGGRADHLQEVGTAQLALGRALAAQGRLEEAEQWIARADATFEQASSSSHRSSAWIAQGDVESQRGNDGVAAGLVPASGTSAPGSGHLNTEPDQHDGPPPHVGGRPPRARIRSV